MSKGEIGRMPSMKEIGRMASIRGISKLASTKGISKMSSPTEHHPLSPNATREPWLDQYWDFSDGPEYEQFFGRSSGDFIAMGAVGGSDDPSEDQQLTSEQPTERKEWQGHTTPLLKSRRRTIVFVGLVICWITKSMDETLVTTIAPILADKFNRLDLIGWLQGGYLFPAATLAVGMNKLSTMFDYHWFAYTGSAILGVGNIICIAAPNAAVFLLGRVVAGVGSAALIPVASVCLSDITTEHERPMYFAFVTSIDVVNLAIGSLLGGAISSKADYRWSFALLTLLLLVGTLLTYPPFKPTFTRIKKTTRQHIEDFDVIGFGILLTACLMSLLGPQMASQSGNWADGAALICGITAFVMFMLFFVQQKLHPNPEKRFFPPALFERDVALILALGFILLFATYTVLAYLSVFLQAALRLDPFQASVSLLGYLFPVGAGSIITGVSLAFVPWYNLIIYAGTALSTLGAFLLTLLKGNSSRAMASGLGAIAGIGFGMSSGFGVIFAQMWVPRVPELQHLALSASIMIQMFGGTLGLVVGGAILNTQISARLNAIPGLSAETRLEIIKGLAEAGQSANKAPPSPEVAEFIQTTLPDLVADSTRVIFYMAGIAAGVSFVIGFFVSWRRRV